MSTIIINQVQSQLQGVLQNQIQQLGLKISPADIQRISSILAQQSAPTLVNQVGTTANKNLNDIPKNLIGNINPVNITTQNVSSNQLSQTLSNNINNSVSPDITNSITNNLESLLRTTLPKGTLQNVNLNSLLTSFNQSTLSSLTPAVDAALNEFSDSVFSNPTSTPETIPNISNIFESDNLEVALDKIENDFALEISNKYLEKAELFDIKNPSNEEKLANSSRGFVDPQANYPTADYNDRSEVNKLATGDVTGTVVQKKNKERLLGAKLPGGESWNQPESPFRGQYPYNKVTETEQGHIIEVDDTPGAERIHIYHKSGTFVEIDSNGSIVKRAVGSSYEIIDRNGKISIAGRADISINGACNIYVGNDANIEVDGDTNITCHNDITAQAGGTFNLSAVEEFNITSKKIFMEAYETMDIKSNDSLQIFSNDQLHIKSTTNMYVQAEDYHHKTVNHYIQGENLYHKHDNFYLEASSDIHIQGSSFNVDADPIHLNSGTSTGSQDSESASIALPSNIGILQGRKDIIANNIEDPVSVSIADSLALGVEEELADEKEIAAFKDKLILSGIVSKEEFERGPVVQATDTVASQQNKLVEGDVDLLKATDLPGNYFISPNFTIEMLSSKAAVSKYKIESRDDITYGQIVFNLHQIALNILEPAFNTFPNLFVTSGYRTPSSSSKTSQHILGMAVDIQFKGATKQQYYEYAQQLALILNYDQLLLEYCNYTNNPWVHLSFSGSNNRKQILTFWNHRKHSDGLAQLA